ncbi:hypothetical protein TorRG33x02_209980 [Trema orientale]|uniref:Uncharacterized protein n=1 Tax=Trema orientale TaxID=63057 RepID=A0A2P5ECC3_TREOI|nr:hypothetical protein TorRG33x02_209980 [Trema orientale]
MVNSMCAVPLDLAPSKVVDAVSEGLVTKRGGPQRSLWFQ